MQRLVIGECETCHRGMWSLFHFDSTHEIPQLRCCGCVKKDGVGMSRKMGQQGKVFYVCSSPRGSQFKECVVCKEVL